MPITYEVIKIVQEGIGKRRRHVFATIEKIVNLQHHLCPEIKTILVSYPVWDGQHMCHLVNTLPPCKALNYLEVQDIAKVLKLFN